MSAEHRQYLGIGEVNPASPDQVNPKDFVGVTKVPIGLFPPSALLYGALGFLDGAYKYGPFNWREHPVRMSIYLDAMERHITALRDRQDDAPDSGMPHLAHILACAAIIVDAKETGNLVDDRPLPGPAADLADRLIPLVKAIRDKHSARSQPPR